MAVTNTRVAVPDSVAADAPESASRLERLWALATSDAALWCVVAAGVVLRLARYADNRSLWLDEAFLALNILEKSPGELLGRLDYLQAAPPGFLLLEKLAAGALGEAEYALRLVPLLGGIASLVLFALLARRFLRRGPLLLALVLMSVNESLIYYSSEVKPYSTDVAVALVLLLLALHVLDARKRIWRYGLLIVAGTVGVWLSYPAVFVLAAIVPALVVAAVRVRDWRALGPAAGAGVVWLASFGGVYALTSKNTSRVTDAIFGGGGSHDTLGGLVLKDSVRDAWGLFVDPGRFAHGINGLAAVAFLIGAFGLARSRRAEETALVLVPFAAVFGASLIDRYPLGGRFALFLTPLLLLLIARGVQELSTLSVRPSLLAPLIAAFLVLPPTADAIGNLVDPPQSQHVRPLLRYLTQHAQPGDILYVSRNAQYALRYYGECDDCDAWTGDFPWPLRAANAPRGFAQPALASVPPTLLAQQAVEGDQVLADLRELDGLPRHRRIWFLFSHPEAPRGIDEETLYVAYLDHKGRQLDARIEGRDASLYLYELGR